MPVAHANEFSKVKPAAVVLFQLPAFNAGHIVAVPGGPTSIRWRKSFIAPPGSPPTRPRCCDQIATPAENQLYPYSEHSCAHRHSHDFGKLFGD